MTTTTNPETLHDPTAFGYSHVAEGPAASHLVHIAGQYSSDADGLAASSDFATQVRQSFDNLGVALRAAGLGYADVVRLGTYIVDLESSKLEALVAVIRGIWGDRPPAQTVIGVAALALPGVHFEVDAVAARSAQHP